MMKWVQVDSTNIDRVGYNRTIKTLAIEFKNGSRYIYGDVPPETVVDLLMAPSVGRFFNENIAYKFKYIKV